jgi:hypothetical protein
MNLYAPERGVAIEESPLLYKGRLCLLQCIPQKRGGCGLRTYMLHESKGGYLYSTVIYTEKGTKFDEQFIDLPLSSHVVMTLQKLNHVLVHGSRVISK